MSSSTGVGMMTRKLANAVSPTVELTKKDDDMYNLKMASTLKSQELNFRLGEEIDEETMDGRKVKTVFTLKDNILTQVQRGTDKTLTVIREFTPTHLKATMPIDNIVCTRVFKVQ
ncbi:hypothetical protein B566_EDAN009942 [Ephemera danica]|nr:hypothetical protein B566_EDAN009942 [Ephemera danica]